MSTGQKLKSKSESETFESTLSEVLPILGSEISLKFPETKLTSEELDHLSSVMLRAKKFEEEEAKQMRLFEGQLYKYTNVVKGWQYRWFVINPTRGTLEYYMVEERRRTHPRGFVYLSGCQVNPSEEDSQTFTVYSSCGEVYKLKALDAKNRQIWVDELRKAKLKQEGKEDEINYSASVFDKKRQSDVQREPELVASLEKVYNQMTILEKYHTAMINSIEEISNTDRDLLMIKATSMALVNGLEHCTAILECMCSDVAKK